MCKNLPIWSSALQWRSSASLAACVEFFENEVVFSLCEDDASLLRRKPVPHLEQKFAVSSNFSSQLNGHSGFGHFIVVFFADSWASIVQLLLQRREPHFEFLPFMPLSHSWRKLLPGKEPPRLLEIKVETELARKKKLFNQSSQGNKGYLATHGYYNRVGKQRTWAIHSKLIKSRTHYLYKSDAFEKQTVTLITIKEKKRVPDLLSMDTLLFHADNNLSRTSLCGCHVIAAVAWLHEFVWIEKTVCHHKKFTQLVTNNIISSI